MIVFECTVCVTVFEHVGCATTIMYETIHFLYTKYSGYYA